MPQFAISITKRIAFRGGLQEFSNTYNYAGIGTMPNEAQAEALIDEVADAEKLMHSTLVSFVYGRCWSSGGTQAENQMIAEKDLTGTGSTTAGTNHDPERAVLVQWPAGNDTRGRKVYLRKWYHAVGNFAGLAISTAMTAQSTAFTPAQRAIISAAADVLSRIGTNSDWGLVAESGRERDGGVLSADPPIAHPWLEHHQLGEMWRA